MPTTSSIQKRARKSIAPTRPPIVPPPSKNSSIDRTVCHLCGYLGRTKSISIEKNGYSFLRHLPSAPGALPVDNNTHHVRACHLCVLLLDKQRELNHTSTNFFFKGFFRSTGSCHTNVGLRSTSISNSIDEEERSLEIIPSEPNLQPIVTEIAQPLQQQSRSIPPPLRKTSPSTTTSTNQYTFSSINQRSSSNSLDLQISDEMSSFNSFLTSIRSRFLSDYTSLISSSKINSYDSCQLCLSIKPHGTLYSLSKNQFDFLSSSQIDVCTLCYYNLIDQYKKQIKTYCRPRPQCYLCHCRLNFPDWEIKLLETDHLPFLLNLSSPEQLYDNQRLALVCDQCFYTILFQYIDQQRENIPIEQRTYSWQCTYSYENEHFFKDTTDLFYISSSSNKTV